MTLNELKLLLLFLLGVGLSLGQGFHGEFTQSSEDEKSVLLQDVRELRSRLTVTVTTDVHTFLRLQKRYEKMC